MKWFVLISDIQPSWQEITLSADETRRLDINLTPEGVLLEGVEVTAEKELEEETRRIGVNQLSIETVQRIPTILEPDVFRSLQLLPGVKAASRLFQWAVHSWR